MLQGEPGSDGAPGIPGIPGEDGAVGPKVGSGFIIRHDYNLKASRKKVRFCFKGGSSNNSIWPTTF